MKEAHHHHAWIVPSVYRVLVLLILVPAATAFVSRLTTTTNVGVAGRQNHVMVRVVGSNDDVADNDAFLLEKEYELTEQMVAERGEIEELLMAASVSHPLLPNNYKPAADAVMVKKGFGGAGRAAKNKMKKQTKHNKKDNGNNCQANDAKKHAKVLQTSGLVRIDGILSDSVTDTLRDFVYNIRIIEGNKLKAASMQAKFPTIRRWDLSIPLFKYNKNDQVVATTVAYQALNDVLRNSPVGETMRQFLGTDDAALYELSSYISDPGSSRQVIHADTPCFGTDDDQPVLCTCFIALQDVRMDMGPTVWLPKTNKFAIHDLFFSEEENGQTSTPIKDGFLQSIESVVGVIPKGSCVLFDSRLLHCGTANKSEQDSRALLFFSFQHPKIHLFNPGGDTASIRPDLKGRFRLSNFVQ